MRFMYETDGIALEAVKAVYSGPEREIWELVMGTQIHIGGLKSTMALADAARIAAGSRGVDLCCCTGAGMRALVRFAHVAQMTGVDATPAVIELGRARCAADQLNGQVEFVLADACDTGLAPGCADFVWGEDAWCYVENKAALIEEAARLIRPGGTIGFTDWIATGALMDAEESTRLLRFMKFPNIVTLDNYVSLLTHAGLEVRHAADTGRFAPYVDLYLEIIDKQLSYDVLHAVRFRQDDIDQMAAGMAFMRELAYSGKIAQGMFVATKPEA
jgi:SAM-dependent methyltransferase